MNELYNREQFCESFGHSFIHSRYFHSTSSSPLLLRDAPDYSIDTVSKLTPQAKELLATTSEGLAQGPYIAARVGFEPVTFWTQGTEPTTEPLCPTRSFKIRTLL